MMRSKFTLGLIGSCIAGSALIGGLALPAQADDKSLEFSGFANFTTDYMFRSISNTNQGPAVQAEFDATYGIFYAGMWGSNTAFGENIEIDYYAGVAPTWHNITFDVAGLAYTFPGGGSVDYFELKTGASWSGDAWSFGVNNYWSPDFFQAFGESDAIEGTVGYAFSKKLFNFFAPSLSGTLGFQSYDQIAADYAYWNAGLTLGFLDHWEADIRYYDTDYSDAECLTNSGGRNNCDARVVGSVKASF
jgi:uncharacterized protein (TIGR02001 family)